MRTLRASRWIRHLFLVVSTTAVVSVAMAAPVEGLQRKAAPAVVSADSRLAQPTPIQLSSGTVVVIQPAPPELVARLDPASFPSGLPWTNPAITGNADPRAASQSFTVRGTSAAVEEKTPALNWSAILATLLLVGFFLFRRV